MINIYLGEKHCILEDQQEICHIKAFSTIGLKPANFHCQSLFKIGYKNKIDEYEQA